MPTTPALSPQPALLCEQPTHIRCLPNVLQPFARRLGRNVACLRCGALLSPLLAQWPVPPRASQLPRCPCLTPAALRARCHSAAWPPYASPRYSSTAVRWACASPASVHTTGGLVQAGATGNPCTDRAVYRLSWQDRLASLVVGLPSVPGPHALPIAQCLVKVPDEVLHGLLLGL